MIQCRPARSITDRVAGFITLLNGCGGTSLFSYCPANRLPPGPPRLAPARSESGLSRPLPAPGSFDARQHRDLASLGNRVLPRCCRVHSLPRRGDIIITAAPPGERRSSCRRPWREGDTRLSPGTTRGRGSGILASFSGAELATAARATIGSESLSVIVIRVNSDKHAARTEKEQLVARMSRWRQCQRKNKVIKRIGNQ